MRVGHVAAATIEVIAALLLWSLMRRFVSARWALALVLLYFFGTSVRTISSQALWQHAGVHLAIAVALWLVISTRPAALWRELAAGVALGYGAVVRQTTGLLVPFLPAANIRATALAFLGAAIGLIPLLVYNALAFGNPLEQGYGTKPFDASPLVGLYGLLLSPSRGLLIYEPYIVFAFAAVVLLKPGRAFWSFGSCRWCTPGPRRRSSTRRTRSGGAAASSVRVSSTTSRPCCSPCSRGASTGPAGALAGAHRFWVCAAWSLLIFQAAAFVL